jgi:arylsulfatase A-like enzyme
LLLCWLLAPGLCGAETPRYNVLFIAVDDLRPELGCYGNKIVKSPNIDRLAARGLVFNRAYCQQAVCSPSRTSLLTGRRPDTTRVYDLQTHFRKTIPRVIALPQHFKANGYHTQGLSKIYHGGLDDADSWSVPHWRSPGRNYGPEGLKLLGELRSKARDDKAKLGRVRGLPWEAPDVGDDDLADGQTAKKAVELLRELKDKRFFLAVGFLKPHLPFVAPKKYWGLYNEKDIGLSDNPHPPRDCPTFALHNSGELRNYHNIPKENKPLPREQALKLRHGYYACVSYLDAMVGRVLDELDRLKLRDKTVVILWGDHGWHLGDNGLWCKHTNFEAATRAPLILAVPGMKSAGRKTDALVEFVDIYPSLADICGLPLPEGLEGTSFKPLADDPKRPWKKAVFSQYPRAVPKVGRCMGYSMRTERYRFTEWAVPDKKFAVYELYDHQTDPKESVNLAGKAEHAALVKELTRQLRAGWKAAAPK